MLKSNLSTRPFYNDRLVSTVIAAVAVGVVALTAYNVTEVRSLTSQRSGFATSLDDDAAETHRLGVRTAELTSTGDFAGMKALWNDAREANALIDRRMFSWTAFLSVIEKALPYGARVLEVAPKPEKNVMHVEVVVVCQTPDDLRALVEAMEKTGVFGDVFPAESSPNDDGTETSLIRAVYLPTADPAALPPAANAKAKRPGKEQP
jgi:hypothetical protein